MSEMLAFCPKRILLNLVSSGLNSGMPVFESLETCNLNLLAHGQLRFGNPLSSDQNSGESCHGKREILEHCSCKSLVNLITYTVLSNTRRHGRDIYINVTKEILPIKIQEPIFFLIKTNDQLILPHGHLF
jgi:hypothetical protein